MEKHAGFDKTWSTDARVNLEYSRAFLVSARELLTVVEERVLLIKERLAHARERNKYLDQQSGNARDILLTAQRLLQGSNELCQLGQQYLKLVDANFAGDAKVDALKQELAQTLTRAKQLAKEAREITDTADEQVTIARRKVIESAKDIELEERRLGLEEGIEYNAKELLELTERQCALAQERLDRARQRVKRAEQRVEHAGGGPGKTGSDGPAA